MSTYKLQVLFKKDFIGSVLTDLLITDFHNARLNPRICYRFNNSGNISKESSENTTRYSNPYNYKGNKYYTFADSDGNITDNLNSIQYVLVETDISVPPGYLIGQLEITGIYFYGNNGTDIQNQYKYNYYYTVGETENSISNDFYEPVPISGRNWTTSDDSTYYKNIYVSITKALSTNNTDKVNPVCSSVQFCGFDKLPFNLKLTYYFGSSSSRSNSITLSTSKSYTSIVDRKNSTVNLNILTGDPTSSLSLNDVNKAFNTGGWQVCYVITNNGTEYKYGGFNNSTLSNDFKTAFKNQFKLIENTGYAYYPNKNFRNLYPAYVKGLSTIFNTNDINTAKDADWYHFRFQNQKSYDSAYNSGISMINSAQHSYYLTRKLFDTGVPTTGISFNSSGNLVVNINNWKISDETYRSYSYMAGYWMMPMTVSYTMMYKDRGFYDVYYDESYQISRTYEAKYGYLDSFANNLVKIGTTIVDSTTQVNRQVQYTGWIDNNKFNNTFKQLYSNDLEYKIVLYGSYLALSGSHRTLSDNYNSNIEHITLDQVQDKNGYGAFTYQAKSLTLNTISKISNSTLAGFFWGTDGAKAYSSYFVSFESYIGWDKIFNDVRIQKAFYNGITETGVHTKQPIHNESYTYIGMSLALDAKAGSGFTFDEPLTGRYRTVKTGYYTAYDSNNKSKYYRIPIKFTENYKLYYTYYVEKDGGSAYGGNTITLTNGNLLLSDSSYLGLQRSSANNYNKWLYQTSDNNSGKILQNLNNMLYEEYTYNMSDSSYTALCGNTNIVIYPEVSCSIQEDATVHAKLYCKFNNQSKSKYNISVKYELKATSGVNEDLLNKLITGSDADAKTVGATLGELTATSTGVNDYCKIDIYKVTDQSNNAVNYADVVITIDNKNEQYKFSTLKYNNEEIKAAAGDGKTFNIVSISKDVTEPLSGTFKYDGSNSYIVTIKGLTFDNAEKFINSTSSTYIFNFIDSNNQNEDYLHIVNGFDHSIFVDDGSTITEIESNKYNTGEGFKYSTNAEYNVFSYNNIFEFPVSASYYDTSKNQYVFSSYIKASSFKKNSTTSPSQVTHYCYLNQYCSLNAYNTSFDFESNAYSDVISIEPASTKNENRVSYIYLGPEDNFNSVCGASGLNLLSYFPSNTVGKINCYVKDTENTDAYKWSLDTLKSASIYDVAAIFNKDKVNEAVNYFYKNNGQTAYNCYLNLEFITDSKLPAFELNTNLYKYKNEQYKSIDNISSFGNIKPLLLQDQLTFTAYYKALDRIAGSASGAYSFYTPSKNDSKRVTNYFINEYNYTYSASTYSNVFSIPFVDCTHGNADTTGGVSSDLAFVLDNIWLSNSNGTALKFYNSYLDSAIVSNINAYLKTDLEKLNDTTTDDTFYSANTAADAKFKDTNYNPLSATRQELAKILISYYSYASMNLIAGGSPSQWNSWSPTFKNTVKEYKDIFNSFEYYQPSCNGVGVAIALLGSDLKNRDEYTGQDVGIYDTSHGNVLKGKYTTLFVQDCKETSILSDYGSNMVFNSYVSTSINIKNSYTLTSQSDGSTIYFRFNINGTMVPGKDDKSYTSESGSPTTTITLPYGISLQDIYNDSKTNKNATTLTKLYDSLASKTGTSNLVMPIETLEIANIGVQQSGSNEIVWDDEPDLDKISNYSITKKQIDPTYWTADETAIDLTNMLTSSWTEAGQTININNDGSTNVLKTIDISDLLEVADYRRIPYYIGGVSIKLDDEMFSDIEAGQLYGKSNLYNYLKTVFFSNNTSQAANINQDTKIFITDMYFSEDGAKSENNIALGTASNDFKLKFYVSTSSIPDWDASDNINNKRLGNNSSVKQFFNINGQVNTLTLGFDTINGDSEASASTNYIYKFYAKDCNEDASKTYKLFTRLEFNQNLYIKYNIIIGQQDPISATQKFNLLNTMSHGFMQLSTLRLNRGTAAGSAYWGMQSNTLPTFTLTNDIIAQICPVLDHSIYFKAIKNKPYTITYVLYDDSVDNGFESSLTVDTADQIIDVQKPSGALYNYLKIVTINYSGITVPGYTIRLSDGYKFVE